MSRRRASEPRVAALFAYKGDDGNARDYRLAFTGTGYVLQEARPHLRGDGIPTRNDLTQMSDAELAIVKAVREVEAAGASKALTDAVVLLQQARERVADHVEGRVEPASDAGAKSADEVLWKVEVPLLGSFELRPNRRGTLLQPEWWRPSYGPATDDEINRIAAHLATLLRDERERWRKDEEHYQRRLAEYRESVIRQGNEIGAERQAHEATRRELADWRALAAEYAQAARTLDGSKASRERLAVAHGALLGAAFKENP